MPNKAHGGGRQWWGSGAKRKRMREKRKKKDNNNKGESFITVANQVCLLYLLVYCDLSTLITIEYYKDQKY